MAAGRQNVKVSKRRADSREQKTCAGFTLIETIVVVTIFSIVGLGIGASFMAGMKLWNKARDINFTKGTTLLTLEMIAKELRQSIDIEAIGFEGKSDRVSFPTIQGNKIIRVTYETDFASGDLFRAEEKLEDLIIAGGFDEKIERKTLDIDDFSVEYLYYDAQIEEYRWGYEWHKEDGIFSAVKLTVTINEQEFVKTVFIPIA